jgi:hypothetical protein
MARRGWTWFHPKSSVYIIIENGIITEDDGAQFITEDGLYIILE